ncbi:hypothetical protein BDR07DRAFT_1430134, partial [Suillus spraguei]
MPICLTLTQPVVRRCAQNPSETACHRIFSQASNPFAYNRPSTTRFPSPCPQTLSLFFSYEFSSSCTASRSVGCSSFISFLLELT